MHLTKMDFTKGNGFKLHLVNLFRRHIIQKVRETKARKRAMAAGHDYTELDAWDQTLNLNGDLLDVSKEGLAAMIKRRLEESGASQEELDAVDITSPSPAKSGTLFFSDDDDASSEKEEPKYVFQLHRMQLKVFDPVDAKNPIVNLAKLDLLHLQLGEVVRSPDAISMLWKKVDVNGSGTVGMQEWLGFAKLRFGVLAQQKPMNRAYRDTLFAQTSGRFDELMPTPDVSDDEDDDGGAPEDTRASVAARKVLLHANAVAAMKAKASTSLQDLGDVDSVQSPPQSPSTGPSAGEPNSKSRQKGRRRSSVIHEALEGGMIFQAFPFFIARLFRISQLYYAFSHLDTSADGRVERAEYGKRRKKFRKALDLNPNDHFDDEDDAARTEFDEIAKGEEQVGWAGMAEWFNLELEAGQVLSLGPEWGDGGPSGWGSVDGGELRKVPGAKLDSDDFCDLVLYCQYSGRVTREGPLPPISNRANQSSSASSSASASQPLISTNPRISTKPMISTGPNQTKLPSI